MDCGMSCKIISLILNWFVVRGGERDNNKAAKRERRQDKNDRLMMLLMATLNIRVQVYVYVSVETMRGSLMK